MSTTRNNDSRDLFVMLCVRSVCAQHGFHQVSVFVGDSQLAVLEKYRTDAKKFLPLFAATAGTFKTIDSDGVSRRDRKWNTTTHSESPPQSCIIRDPSSVIHFSIPTRIHSMTVCFSTMMISCVIPIIYRLLYNMNTVMPTVLLCDRM
jgi:hypothetical protein